MAAVDANEVEKWTKRVLGLLELGKTPAYLAAQKSANPELISRGLLGGARASTICRRSRMWEGLVRWLQWRHDCAWPRSADDLVGYMADIMQDRPTKTFPRHFAGAVAWFESRSGFPPEQKFAADDLFTRTVEAFQVDAEILGEEVERAPRLLVSVIIALEVAVAMDAQMPAGLRVVAWMRLIKVFGVLRSDDVRRLRPRIATLGRQACRRS